MKALHYVPTVQRHSIMEQTMMKAQKSVSILVFTLFIRLKKLLYIVMFQLAKQGNDKEILLVALIRTPKKKNREKA
jgi:hypothetical protein